MADGKQTEIATTGSFNFISVLVLSGAHCFDPRTAFKEKKDSGRTS